MPSIWWLCHLVVGIKPTVGLTSRAGVVPMMMVSLTSLASALSVNYYEHTCPQVDSIVAGEVHKATINEKTIPSIMLHMHFPDCFIRVCYESHN